MYENPRLCTISPFKHSGLAQRQSSRLLIYWSVVRSHQPETLSNGHLSETREMPFLFLVPILSHYTTTHCNKQTLTLIALTMPKTGHFYMQLGQKWDRNSRSSWKFTYSHRENDFNNNRYVILCCCFLSSVIRYQNSFLGC